MGRGGAGERAAGTAHGLAVFTNTRQSAPSAAQPLGAPSCAAISRWARGKLGRRAGARECRREGRPLRAVSPQVERGGAAQVGFPQSALLSSPRFVARCRVRVCDHSYCRHSTSKKLPVKAAGTIIWVLESRHHLGWKRPSGSDASKSITLSSLSVIKLWDLKDSWRGKRKLIKKTYAEVKYILLLIHVKNWPCIWAVSFSPSGHSVFNPFPWQKVTYVRKWLKAESSDSFIHSDNMGGILCRFQGHSETWLCRAAALRLCWRKFSLLTMAFSPRKRKAPCLADVQEGGIGVWSFLHSVVQVLISAYLVKSARECYRQVALQINFVGLCLTEIKPRWKLVTLAVIKRLWIASNGL